MGLFRKPFVKRLWRGRKRSGTGFVFEEPLPGGQDGDVGVPAFLFLFEGQDEAPVGLGLFHGFQEAADFAVPVLVGEFHAGLDGGFFLGDHEIGLGPGFSLEVVELFSHAFQVHRDRVLEERALPFPGHRRVFRDQAVVGAIDFAGVFVEFLELFLESAHRENEVGFLGVLHVFLYRVRAPDPEVVPDGAEGDGVPGIRHQEPENIPQFGRLPDGVPRDHVFLDDVGHDLRQDRFVGEDDGLRHAALWEEFLEFAGADGLFLRGPGHRLRDPDAFGAQELGEGERPQLEVDVPPGQVRAEFLAEEVRVRAGDEHFGSLPQHPVDEQFPAGHVLDFVEAEVFLFPERLGHGFHQGLEVFRLETGDPLVVEVEVEEVAAEPRADELLQQRAFPAPPDAFDHQRRGPAIGEGGGEHASRHRTLHGVEFP